MPVYIDQTLSERRIISFMSHFTVAVFTEDEEQDLDELMEPFSENLEVEQYVSMTRDDLVREERRRMQAVFENQYAEWQKDPAAYEKGSNPEHIEYLKSIPELLKRTDEEIYKDEIRGYDKDSIDDNGNVLSTYNPDSKWDWYEVGGRWQGMLLLKPGKTGERGSPGLMTKMSENYDSAFALDVDFHMMRKQRIQELSPYHKAMTEGFYKEDYMRKRFPSNEEYVQRQSTFSTYAVLTPDGEWLSSGEMGWFGISSESTDDERDWEDNYYDRFIKPAITNGWYLTIVDCHI